MIAIGETTSQVLLKQQQVTTVQLFQANCRQGGDVHVSQNLSDLEQWGQILLTGVRLLPEISQRAASYPAPGKDVAPVPSDPPTDGREPLRATRNLTFLAQYPIGAHMCSTQSSPTLPHGCAGQPDAGAKQKRITPEGPRCPSIWTAAPTASGWGSRAGSHRGGLATATRCRCWPWPVQPSASRLQMGLPRCYQHFKVSHNDRA